MTSTYIVSDVEVLGGTPCLRGTRLSVYAVAARFAAGESPASILDGYPDIPLDAVQAAAEYAAANPFREHRDARPWRARETAKDVA